MAKAAEQINNNIRSNEEKINEKKKQFAEFEKEQINLRPTESDYKRDFMQAMAREAAVTKAISERKEKLFNDEYRKWHTEIQEWKEDLLRLNPKPFYDDLCEQMKLASEPYTLRSLSDKFLIIDNYSDSEEKSAECIQRINDIEARHKYDELCIRMDGASSIDHYREIAQEFRLINDFMDAQQKADECDNLAAELEDKMIAAKEMKFIHCHKCGEKNIGSDMFCTACGAKMKYNYCQECGAKNNTSDTYCTACGVVVFKKTVQYDDASKEAKYGAPKQSKSFLSRINAMRRSAKLLLVITGVFIVAIITTAIIGASITNPQNIAKGYFEAKTNGDWEKMFGYLSLDSSEFINMSSFSKYMENENKLEIINFNIIEDISEQFYYESAESSFMKRYVVEYLPKGSTFVQTETITLAKRTGKKLLFFDDYSVSAKSMIATNYQVNVPADADVYIDDIKLTKKSESNQSIDTYVVPKIFFGEHDIRIEHSECKDYIDKIQVFNQSGNDYHAFNFMLKDTVRADIAKKTEEAYKQFLSSALAENEIEQAGVSFTGSGEQYSRLVSALNDGETKYKSVTVTKFTDKSDGIVIVPMKYTCEAEVECDVLAETGGAEMQNTTITAMRFSYTYESGAWHLTGLDSFGKPGLRVHDVFANTSKSSNELDWEQLYLRALLEAQEYITVTSPGNHDFDGKYPRYISGARLTDVNFDGTPELLLYGDGSDSGDMVRILTINDTDVEKAFVGRGDLHDPILYRKVSDGTLAYSYSAGEGDEETYAGYIYITNSKTDLFDYEKTTIAASVSTRTDLVYDPELGFEVYTTVEYEFNGIAVSEAEFMLLRDNVLAGYEEVSYEPAVFDWRYDATVEDFIAFIDSYRQEK